MLVMKFYIAINYMFCYFFVSDFWKNANLESDNLLDTLVSFLSGFTYIFSQFSMEVSKIVTNYLWIKYFRFEINAYNI